MNILGIVAEYNPFHNGHLYMIQSARGKQPFDAVVCAMSGSFLQRGEPAICSKWARAEMALRCGADLILEIPFAFAVRSAYNFARGGVQLLSQTGVVTHLGFGSESGDLEMLKSICSIIRLEPEQFKSYLKNNLSRGLSYPAARAEALQDYIPNAGPNLPGLLSGANNILALEYLRVIEDFKLSLQPLTVARKGSHYHDRDITEFSSATAIRDAVSKLSDLDRVKGSLPSESYEVFKNELEIGRAPITPQMMEDAILTQLRLKSVSELASIHEVSEGLEYRIMDAALQCGTLEELKKHIKSRRYSLTRINRILLYVLFGLTKERVKQFDQCGPCYLHVLGLSPRGQDILQQMKKTSPLKILNRGKDVKAFYEEQKNTAAGDMMALDIMASDVYSLFMPEPGHRKGGQDFLTSPILVTGTERA